MTNYHVVVVDDETSNLESLARILTSDGAQVKTFHSGREALDYVRREKVDVLLSDLRMSGMSGLELLEAVKVIDPHVEVVVITAYGTVEVAVKAMKKGAYDFITKPLQRLPVLRTVHRALEKRALSVENHQLREELIRQKRDLKTQIIGKSLALKQVLEVADQAAQSRASVLIEGESGTGKGIVAEYLHSTSEFSNGAFVKLNCAAIPENLLEAEMFGYEAGAFTGANKLKRGRVELANDGTLFLDEIGLAPLSIQGKLLRFLQEGEFERLGSNQTRTVECRFISATNLNLKQSAEQGKFREDLFYRINVIHIQMPPLRDRIDDIPLLAQSFLEWSAEKNKREVPLLHPDTIECLMMYRWPGNIRELQNLMERLVVLNRTGIIHPDDLPSDFSHNQRQKAVTIPIGIPLKEVAQIMMDRTLQVTRGDKRLAASLLGVHPRTIYRHLEQSDQSDSTQQKEEGADIDTAEMGSL